MSQAALTDPTVTHALETAIEQVALADDDGGGNLSPADEAMLALMERDWLFGGNDDDAPPFEGFIPDDMGAVAYPVAYSS